MPSAGDLRRAQRRAREVLGAFSEQPFPTPELGAGAEGGCRAGAEPRQQVKGLEVVYLQTGPSPGGSKLAAGGGGGSWGGRRWAGRGREARTF